MHLRQKWVTLGTVRVVLVKELENTTLLASSEWNLTCRFS